MVRGFLLNNQLTDFSFAPADAEGSPIANRVEGGKRPRSSMASTIVLDGDGRPELLTGSPGGSKIIGYVAHSVYAVYDFGMDPQSAADLPHYQNDNEGATLLERPIANVTTEYDYEGLVRELEGRGHAVKGEEMRSGLGIIAAQRAEDGATVLSGGADPRRGGVAGGAEVGADAPRCAGAGPASGGTETVKWHRHTAIFVTRRDTDII